MKCGCENKNNVKWSVLHIQEVATICKASVKAEMNIFDVVYKANQIRVSVIEIKACFERSHETSWQYLPVHIFCEPRKNSIVT